ncbi:16S rRNA (cytidine(1402)-2'-O)-methyltransferase [Alkaliphilus peptidifermentans]|uniref:Ribosomal RNA small subunit methyltransferase I n=1 Tax=Alkaliphilus peptidifermentans DSM 18978 TaxID=1120976 RepID=A0A1G5ANV9_9FIRM|nr:16S rRNA (cytidine(1402)-2'-O)-methyltransferase [Alkaliphilus peptidifermentans]SCX79555.1 16S rRNA (cytidine1402-2'-O)-methyltransferase [Alkaliphilus peptidifermentans DSM 18978]
MNRGKLYICPTPIGNLEDITIKALRIMKEVDLIAAEDTRHTIKLLNHYEIDKPLTSYHEHNKHKKGEILIQQMREGKNIALVSDAGMPGISDPGADIIKLCIEEDIEFEVLPGATASILALVASGFDTSKFAFEGFLHREKKKRKERLTEIKHEDRTLIFYEAPHRLTGALNDMLEILGNRRVVICRELTKRYEEFVRGTIKDLILHFQENPPKGEIVIVCHGVTKEEVEEARAQALEDINKITIKDHIYNIMKTGVSKKEAIKEVAKIRGISKREVYQESIDI